ncbi:EscV/YscV/HrcV family type III secretion system export apparatus protein [Ochrobactrum sp. POC9]|uniref:type III secretion system export apparatus subunit SctV n=1 Tax=unclassified Ochrobactrum TaxID=239106 RepID=UPI000D7050FA|nr:type III secretion system export apparatus subunit SctV [Ochrobactrum sp. POC9]MCH4542837.1 type III secretion system export apparatus subunit SctV [Ochrobactrum sp. A-1]PWU71056.1 EscV/YscV/HrcV family type III secretion system export apparatus protein [Ochrobactrum sp. POC9]
MMNRISRFLARARNTSDIVIAVLVLVAVSMMVIPLPTWAVDGLITLNIAFSVLILLSSLYATTPLQFSALPSAILIATLFRLAITITTTRLILLQADAGEIVTAFGNFVVGGSIAVGLIIFFIITIAQFVVIAKGAERVAEVAARFTLDALPGKQMSIDAELRNGDINQAQARAMRQTLEQESQFFGAMDGAMKFVKGDVLAGMVFIFVNLIGGLAVGVLQHEMGFAEAGMTYSLLSVGDGLVAQIPALLVAVAAGTMVTRVASAENGSDLGRQITSQLLRNSRSLIMASLIMFVLAIVPGFPMPVFIMLGLLLGVAGYAMQRNQVGEDKEAGETVQLRQVSDDDDSKEHLPVYDSPLVIRIGTELATDMPADLLQLSQNEARSLIGSELGIDVPPVPRLVDGKLKPRQLRIDLDDVPVLEMEIPSGCVLVDEDPAHLELAGISGDNLMKIQGLRQIFLVAGDHQELLAGADIPFRPIGNIVGPLLGFVFRTYSQHFIGIQETNNLLQDLSKTSSELVAQVKEAMPTTKVLEVLRMLVAEGVTIRNLRVILEALIEAGNEETRALNEKIRMALKRQISFAAADDNHVIAAFILERSAEHDVRSALRHAGAGAVLDLSDDALHSIAQQIKQLNARSTADTAPVVITAADIRPHLRALLVHHGVDISVLSYQELAFEFNVQPLGTVTGSSSGNSVQGRLTNRMQDVGHSQQA